MSVIQMVENERRVRGVGMRLTFAVAIFLHLVLGLAPRADAQAPFKVTRGPDDTKFESRVQKAIKEIEEVSAKARPEAEAVDEVLARSQAAIGRLKASGERAIPKIETVLMDSAKDWKVKAMMCEALGRINGAQSVSLLERVLTDTKQSEFVRAVAGHSLVAMGRTETEGLIKRTVSDPSVPIKIRARVMMAVGSSGLDDVDWLKKISKGEGLGLPADKHARISEEEFGLVLNAQRGLGVSKNPKAFDALLELAEENLGNPNFVEMLGRKKDRRAIPVLVKALTAKPRVSNSDLQAAIALGEMRATEAVDDLVRVMREDPSPILVAHICEALAKIGDGRAVGPMQTLVDNLRSDPRFNDAAGIYWRQEQYGTGPIVTINRALSMLKK